MSARETSSSREDAGDRGASSGHETSPGGSSQITAWKADAASIRKKAADRLADGSDGMLVAASIAERTCRFVEQLTDEAVEQDGEDVFRHLRSRVAVVGVGGTGRGQMCPYSDVDLMILSRREEPSLAGPVDRLVQSIWDAGLKLGQSCRTVRDAIRLAREDAKTATSFVQSRLIWGSSDVHDQFRSEFRGRVVTSDPTGFIKACCEGRAGDWTDTHPAVQTLEPNVKTGLGGLRDIDLLTRVAYAAHQTTDLDVLQLQRNLSPADARTLREAWEFLLRTRIRMHLLADGPQEILRRDLQVQLADDEGYAATESQRPVELFMRDYFRHSAGVAEVSGRFVASRQSRPLGQRIVAKVLRRRRGGLIVGRHAIDVIEGRQEAAVPDFDAVMQVYRLASSGGREIRPRLTDRLRAVSEVADTPPSSAAAASFREVLSCGATLAPVLRHMADTRTLDHLIPAWADIRSLLQFNHYHSYTVDEHTVRAVAEAGRFETDDGPVGRAYRRIRSRDLFHLAILLHDIGKGHDEDHSVRGARIARDVAGRLHLDEPSVDQLETLVLEHLNMADAAFRRDINDQALLTSLAERLGSPETLLMLYALTVADIRAVGPGKWTPWKAELLSDLFERLMVIVSGRSYGGFEEERVADIRRAVAERTPPGGFDDVDAWRRHVFAEFVDLPTYYIMSTPPDQIAADLALVRTLGRDDIHVAGTHDPATGLSEYRVILHASIGGCFQKMCGVLAARNFEIHSAEIATTRAGYVIDAFTVRDPEVLPDRKLPRGRIDELRKTMTAALSGKVDVASLFTRYERFDAYLEDSELPSGLTSKVRLDNDTSEDRTILDVFTKDRRGLLYFLAKSLRAEGVEIELAKISTHFDQVIDVFYIQTPEGTKLPDEWANRVAESLRAKLHAFVTGGFRDFRRT